MNADGSEPEFDPGDNPEYDPDTQDDGLPASPDEGVDDDDGYGDYTPGFGITSVLVMFAATAILRNRRE